MCPSDLQKFVDGLAENEPIELQFSCLGGDVLGGLQICSILSDAQKKGHKTIANVTSIAASMASVVACACQELNLYEGAFLMCHLPWTMTMGNSKDLQKEIATLEQLKNAMEKFYKTKFELTDEELDKMLEDETWIDADNYKDYKLNCNIVENGEPLKIAASISKKHFKNIPMRILDMKNKAENVSAEETLKEEIVEEVTEQKKEPLTPEEEKKIEEVVEEVTTEKSEEEVVEEVEKTPDELKEEIEALKSRVAELEKENEELKAKCGEEKAEDVSQDETEVTEEKVEEKTEEEEETVTKAEADKRVSGMQSKMQSQVNALSTELTNFKNQLQAKEEELKSAKVEITSLKDSLEKSEGELSAMASTLEEKTKALDMLNANVNHAPEELPTMNDGLAKCSTPAEKVAFLKSGKYVR